jgi:hypothetical protein
MNPNSRFRSISDKPVVVPIAKLFTLLLPEIILSYILCTCILTFKIHRLVHITQTMNSIIGAISFSGFKNIQYVFDQILANQRSHRRLFPNTSQTTLYEHTNGKSEK